jgi:putative membrane protein
VHVIWRLVINALALWVATQVVNGISFKGDWLLLLGVSLVFGVLNIVVRPVLKLLTLPFFFITLGLFTFVLNAFMLWLTGMVSMALGFGFYVDGPGAALVGGLVVSVVSFALSLVVKSGEREKKKKDQ